MSTARSNRASTNTLEGRLTRWEGQGKLLGKYVDAQKSRPSTAHLLAVRSSRHNTAQHSHFYWHGQSTCRCEADGHKGTSSPALHHSYREAHILSERQLETFFSPAQNARFKNKKGHSGALLTPQACWRACQQGGVPFPQPSGPKDSPDFWMVGWNQKVSQVPGYQLFSP